MAEQQGKYLAVEGIRGIACFIVVLSHLSLTFFPFLHSFEGEADWKINPLQSFIHESPLGFFYSGTSAVFIFFVLSGFILTKVALKGDHVPIKILTMGIKRYPRLMLPALASCVISFVAFQIITTPNTHLSDWINGYGDFPSSLTGAIYSGTIEVFFFSGRSSYNPVLWTMKIELLGSIVIYLLCLNRAGSKVPFLVGVSAMLISILIVFRVMDKNMGLGMISFMGGYLFCVYGREITGFLSVLFLVIGIYFAGAHNGSWSYTILYVFLGENTYILCNFISGFFIVYVVIFNLKMNKIFSGKTIVFMGKVSFSVYLIHLPIISTVGVFLFNVFFQCFASYSLAALMSSVIAIIVIYISSLAFYWAIDTKGMAVSNWIAGLVISNIGVVKKTNR